MTCLPGLFGLTFLLPNIIIIIFILKVKCVACNVGRILETMNKSNKILVMQAMVISGSLALVDRGVLKHDEAVIHYRCQHILPFPILLPLLNY